MPDKHGFPHVSKIERYIGFTECDVDVYKDWVKWARKLLHILYSPIYVIDWSQDINCVTVACSGNLKPIFFGYEGRGSGINLNTSTYYDVNCSCTIIKDL